MYCLFSANEYVTHRYYQHNEIGKMWFYKTLRKFNMFPKIDGGGETDLNVVEVISATVTLANHVQLP